MKNEELRMRSFLLVIALLAFATLLPAQGTIVIQGGTVHTISGQVIPNGTVVVRDGKITAVGAHVSAPGGAKVIDARGLHVYPGMIDSGTTMGMTEIGSVRETSDTNELGDFNPQLRAYTVINPASEHIPVTRANGITSVVASPAGGIISGQASLINLAGWTIEDMAVKKSLGIIINFPTIRSRGGFDLEGGGFRRGAPVGYTEAKRTYERQVEQLHDWLEKARHYGQARAAEEPGLKHDLKLEALVPLVKGETPGILAVSSARDVKNAIEFAQKEKIKIILTPPAGGFENGRGIEDVVKAADLLKKNNIPVVLGPTFALPEREDDPYDEMYATPGKLYQAGVKFAFGSYATSFSRNLPYQAAQAVAFGLPPDEAYKAVSMNAAEIWGAKELGSIETGKMANLIITDGDPLQSRTQVKQLIINGRVTSMENKHHLLYEKYLARP